MHFKVLFLIGLVECEEALAKAIAAAGDEIEVICFQECHVNHSVIRALIPSGGTLKAVLLNMCRVYGNGRDDARFDEAVADLCRAATGLVFLGLELRSIERSTGVGNATYNALPESLVFFSHNGWPGYSSDDFLAKLKPSIQANIPRLTNLKFTSILPNLNDISRVKINPLKITAY